MNEIRAKAGEKLSITLPKYIRVGQCSPQLSRGRGWGTRTGPQTQLCPPLVASHPKEDKKHFQWGQE